MGHLRLYTLPDTPRWRRVVRTIADGSSAAKVAQATAEAASDGLDLGRADPAFNYTLFLLTRLVRAALEPDFGAALVRAGVTSGPAPEVLDVTTGFAAAVDAHARLLNTSDLGEMSRLSAVETLNRLLADPARGPVDTTPEQVHAAARGLATPAGFGELCHDYFSTFAHRFLTYHLGRELSFHVGGNGRFADTEAHDRFVRDLDDHCQRVTAAIRERATHWFSTFQAPAGMTAARVRRFATECLESLRQGLLMPGGHDG